MNTAGLGKERAEHALRPCDGYFPRLNLPEPKAMM